MKAERQNSEAQTKLDVLSNYFKQKEIELQRSGKSFSHVGQQESLYRLWRQNTIIILCPIIELINLICIYIYEYRSVLMNDKDKKKIVLYWFIFGSTPCKMRSELDIIPLGCKDVGWLKVNFQPYLSGVFLVVEYSMYNLNSNWYLFVWQIVSILF